MRKKTAIIGGGAAGLFACCQLKNLASKQGVETDIVIYEKESSLGRKLLLTGHGRCNLTNAKEPRELKKAYHEAGNFIYPAISEFTPFDTMKFASEVLGLDLVEQENNRIFPASEKSSDVLDAILKYIESDGNVEIRLNTKVLGLMRIDYDSENFGRIVVATESGEDIYDSVILATGGKSFSKTGSDGSGFEIASKAGHNIMPLHAGLSSVKVTPEDREFTGHLSGLSVNANAGLYISGRKSASEEGDVLFTHEGLSGPAIMELSRYIPSELPEDDENFIELDFVSHMRDEELDKSLIAEINSHPDTKLTNLATSYVPKSLAEELAEKIMNDASEKECSEIKTVLGRAEVTKLKDLPGKNITGLIRKKYSQKLKHLELHLDGAPELETAYVTVGGVSTDEIDRKTMMSSKIENLYIIGEMLDVDGKSGGYNLQACMSEAYLAVKSIIG